MIDFTIENPEVILTAIENDPTAFMQGSRNDDICNWVFAKILCENRRNTLRKRNELWFLNEFVKVRNNLTKKQKASLNEWSESVRDKIITCVTYYRHSSVDDIRNNLAIDQGGYHNPHAM